MMQKPLDRRTVLKGLSLLPLASLMRAAPAAWAQDAVTGKDAESKAAPNILILIFDTLSARHMSLYGYERPTTPNFERLAERSTVYHAHYAAGNFTTPGTASLLTGNYPWTHRGFHYLGTVHESFKQRNLFSAFGDDGIYTRIAYSHNLLADTLLYDFDEAIDQHINVSQFCLINGSFADRLFPNDTLVATRSFEELLLRREQLPASLFLSLLDRLRLRLDKAQIERYATQFPAGVPHYFKLAFRLEDTMDGIVSTLADAPAPFLAYFHLLPPHQPYCPRREFVGAFDDGWQPAPKDARFFSQKVPEKRLGLLRQQYDEFIGYVDAELGRLLAMLAQNGQLDNTIVVVTSDHGELFERGIHGHETETLYAPVVHVPLLISLPGQAQRHDVYTPTSCIDLLPTLLHLAGRPIPDWCEGTILPNFSTQKVAEGRSLFALEAKRNRKQLALTRYTVALRQGEFMLTHYVGYRQVDDAFELYDLASDPEQRRDLYPDRPAILSSLRDEIRARLDEANKPYGAHAG